VYIEAGQAWRRRCRWPIRNRPTRSATADVSHWRDKLQLALLVEGDTLFYNVYHVMEVPQAGAGARALADFFVSPEHRLSSASLNNSLWADPLYPDAEADRW